MPVKRKPAYYLIKVNGADSASPDPCSMKKGDWVAWVNPGGDAFTVQFVNVNPLKPKKNKIAVGKGAPTTWFRFRTDLKRKGRYEYQLAKVSAKKPKRLKPGQKRKGIPGPPPGPEIIGGD